VTITRSAVVYALALSLAGALSVPPACAEGPPVTLDNGLRVFVTQRVRADVVGWDIIFRYPALSASVEPPGLRSLTQQVLLDALFARLKSDPAMRDERDARATVQMGTEWEYVEARGKVVSADLGAALKLIADTLTTIRPSAQDVEAARGRLIAASDANAADIGEGTFALFRQALEGGDVPTATIHASAAQLKALTPDDVAGALARYYVAANACLTVVAPQSPAETLREVGSALGSLPRRPVPPLPALPPRPTTSRTEVGDLVGADRASLMVGVGLPPIDSPDFHVGQVIAAALSGKGGRFERDDSLYAAFGMSKPPHPLPEGAVLMLGVPYSLRPFLVVHAVVDPMNLEEASPAISKHILDLAEVAMPEAELRRAKARAIGDWALDGDRAVSLANRLNLYQAFGLDPRNDARMPERIRTVTAEQIMQFADKYFGRIAVGVRMPD
jgi:predicted Zn-dependent peptidase